jgi:hypothetical protein
VQRPALVGFAASVQDRLEVLTAPRPRRPTPRLLAHVLPGAAIAVAACGVPRAQLSRPPAPSPGAPAAAGAVENPAVAPARPAALAGQPAVSAEAGGTPDVQGASGGSAPASAMPRRPTTFVVADGRSAGAARAEGQASASAQPAAEGGSIPSPVATGQAAPAAEPAQAEAEVPGTVTALLLSADGRTLRHVQITTASLPHMPELTSARDGRAPLTLDVRGALEAVFPGERFLSIGGQTEKHGTPSSASYLIWGRIQ